MMIRRHTLLFSFFFLVWIGAMGCKSRIADLTVLSTKNVPHDFQMRGKGEGSDERYYVLIFPTRLSDPNMRRAVDRAIDSQNGDVLLNARIHWRCWYIPLLFGKDGYTTTGDVASTHAEPSRSPPP